MCMLYRWSVDECLSMPAKRFFAMRRAGHKVRKQFITPILAELVDIARVPNLAPKSVQKMREAYLREAAGVKIQKKGAAMDPLDQHTKNVLLSHFKTAKRLRGLA
jgi:hypothetical protein